MGHLDLRNAHPSGCAFLCAFESGRFRRSGSIGAQNSRRKPDRSSGFSVVGLVRAGTVEVALNSVLGIVLVCAFFDLLGVFVGRSGATMHHRIAFGAGITGLCGLLGALLIALKVGVGFLVLEWNSMEGILLAGGLVLAFCGAVASVSMLVVILYKQRRDMQ
jgi:hypothetical protein